jgi:hypothetical protein
MPRGGQTRAARIIALEKANKAVEARLAGLDLLTIAREVGYNSPQAAWDAIHRTLKRRTQRVADAAVLEMLGRLDQQTQAIWPEVLKGDIAAGYLALAIEQRRAKLLGLDAAIRIDITQRLREVALAEGLDPDEVEREALAAVKAAEGIIRGSGR